MNLLHAWLLAALFAPSPAPVAEPLAGVTLRDEVTAAREELQRGVAKLRLQDSPGPYYAELRLVRGETLSLDGSYGGVITDVRQEQAAGLVEVRVGSAERDGTGYLGAESGQWQVRVALDPAPEFLRRRLWLAMDQAFRGATKARAQKLIVLDRLAGEPAPPDFSAPPPKVESLDENTAMAVDRAALRELVAGLSARFKAHPKIDNGDVHLQIVSSYTLVVTHDGVTLGRKAHRAVLAVVADGRAADGMPLDHGGAIHLQSLPDAAALRGPGESLVDRVLVELEAQLKAPMLDEDYDGPVLFESLAAAQLLASTVATQASGTPAPLSDGGRLLDLEPMWQEKLGRSVLPTFVDLIDDPTAKGFGAYTIDGQGVRAGRIALVQGGILKTLLMTRTPNRMLPASNGRARMTPALGVGAAISNLTLVSHRGGASQARLERELLRRAREDGYDFAYVVESLRDGTVLGPMPRDGATSYSDGRKLALPVPARVFRIDSNRKRTLVRGVLLAPISMRVLRRIRAVGNRTTAHPMRIAVGAGGGFAAEIGMDGILSHSVDVQVATPDLVIDGFELLIERGEYERLPILVHPVRRDIVVETPTPA